jgi:hypothetical protein
MFQRDGKGPVPTFAMKVSQIYDDDNSPVEMKIELEEDVK